MGFQESLRPDTVLVLGPAFGPEAGKDVARMSAPLIRVLVVDDSAFMRGVLPTKIEADPRFKVIGIACNGREAIDKAVALKPDVITLDIDMPIMNGTQTLLHIKRDPELKNIPVVIYSTSENETEKRKTLSLGALDYIVKPHTLEEGSKMISKFLSYLE